LFGWRKNREQAAGAAKQDASAATQDAGAASQEAGAAAPDTGAAPRDAGAGAAPLDAGAAATGAGAAAARRPRRALLLTLGAIALAVAAGGITWLVAAAHTGSPSASAAVRSDADHASPVAKVSGPFRVLSVTPAQSARHVNGAAPVRVVFSAPLAAGSSAPRIKPAVKGTWAIKGSTMTFTPATAFGPRSFVTVRVPSGRRGVRSATGSLLAAQVTSRFRVGSYSVLRLQQLLAQLGYLPMTWTGSGTPAATTSMNAQLSAAFQPPAGTFSWQGHWPRVLTSQWTAGQPNVLDAGAIRALESQRGLTMDGVAGPAVWRDLMRAAVKGGTNPAGYTYALTSKASPETLTIWHNGHVVLHTLANTGIAVAPTADGTFPVYLRYAFQIMKGTNPDGSKYADPVQNVSYFNGGDAVHYFPRATFGWPQSLGCVELPLAQSAVAYKYLTYGSLVTVR
jgi:peptidoglycan hydrolase-like protein with peptidoglycan-binding domain